MFDARLVEDEDPRVLVLTLVGNFTLDETARVDGLLADAATCDCLGLVLDVSGIEYIDSAGLMVIVSTFHRMDRAGKSMAVATGDNRYAEEKLDELGLLRIPGFETFGSVEEARRALTDRP